MIKNVLMILTAFAAGSTVSYVGGQAVAQASVPTVQQVSAGSAEVTATAQKTALVNWIKTNVTPRIESAYGVSDLGPCKTAMTLVVQYIPTVKLPGDFVPGSVQ